MNFDTYKRIKILFLILFFIKFSPAFAQIESGLEVNNKEIQIVNISTGAQGKIDQYLKFVYRTNNNHLLLKKIFGASSISPNGLLCATLRGVKEDSKTDSSYNLLEVFNVHGELIDSIKVSKYIVRIVLSNDTQIATLQKHFPYEVLDYYNFILGFYSNHTLSIAQGVSKLGKYAVGKFTNSGLFILVALADTISVERINHHILLFDNQQKLIKSILISNAFIDYLNSPIIDEVNELFVIQCTDRTDLNVRYSLTYNFKLEQAKKENKWIIEEK